MWLANLHIVLYTLFVVITWKYIGFGIILFLAGLQGIPPELREAAALDGATPRQSFRHITLPLLGPTIRIWIFLAVVGSLQLFDLVWIMTEGGPANASNTMVTYLIYNGFDSSEFGFGSAVAVILFVICFLFALVYQRFALRRDAAGPYQLRGVTYGRPRQNGCTRHRTSGRPATSLLLGTPISYLAALLVVGVTLVPILYVIVGGFRTSAQINAAPAGLPHPWVMSNYQSILASSSFWHFVGNSLFIAVVATVLAVGLGSMAAFALARYSFKGREFVFATFMIGLLFPASVASLPLYLLLRQIGLLENLLGAAIPEAAFSLPITIFILRPFLRSIPGELEDAAVVDGASRFSFFRRILLPLSRPTVRPSRSWPSSRAGTPICCLCSFSMTSSTTRCRWGWHPSNRLIRRTLPASWHLPRYLWSRRWSFLCLQSVASSAG